MKKSFSSSSLLTKHLWHLAIPIGLGLLTLAVLSRVVYFGSKRESLAALAEAALIETALRPLAPSVENFGKVVLVTGKEEDFRELGPPVSGPLKDFSLSTYLRVATEIAQRQPQLMVVNWLGAAHQLDAETFAPWIQLSEQFKLGDRLLITLPFEITGPLPESVLQKLHFTEARDCFYQVNRFCSYMPWPWIPYELTRRFWTDAKPHQISLNLPHFYPNFILNLPAAENLPQVNFKTVLSGGATAHIAPGSIVFIGSDLRQNFLLRHDKNLLQKTFTVRSFPRRSLNRDGTPQHVLWAQMTQMFIDGSAPAVAPKWLTHYGAILMIFMVMVSIRWWGILSLLPFGMCLILLPLFNIFGVIFFRVYIPLFEILFSGVLTFLGVFFSLFGWRVFFTKRLASQKDIASLSREMRRQMIAMLSHNLNTPVAQLVGLLSLMEGETTDRQHAAAIFSPVRPKVASLQALTQLVLTSTRLEDAGQIPLQDASLIRDFLAQELPRLQGLLKRLGIDLVLFPLTDDTVLLKRLPLDSKTFESLCLAAALILYHGPDSVTLHLHLTRREHASELTLESSHQETLTTTPFSFVAVAQRLLGLVRHHPKIATLLTIKQEEGRCQFTWSQMNTR